MRLRGYLVFLLITAFFSLLRTHQHFLLTKANYTITARKKCLSHLLDRNKELMYNVSELESPANLEAKLGATGVNYDMPARWAVARKSEKRPAYRLAKVAERRNVTTGGIFDFLTVKAEARAHED